jgi:hypothetical protein
LDCNDNYALILGATQQTYIPLLNGSYAVQINENSCTDTSACYNFVWLHEATILEENNWLIYPNPTQDKLFIKQKTSVDIRVELVDNLGRVLQQKHSKERLIDLDLRALPAAMYTLRLYQGQQFISKKIIKME